MEMNIGNFKYRNSNKNYVTKLFRDIPKANGKMVAISNGGYVEGNGTKMRPHFGYRIYWDSKTGQFNCQVISQVRDVLFGDYLREYSVIQKEDSDTSLDSVTTAILYNEYRIR
jgi:hypothetical protein